MKDNTIKMTEPLQFDSRHDFREWLSLHHASEEGFWLLFGKTGGPKTLKAVDALEEALCFGWIDGQMKSIDEKTYIKYFSSRRKNSKWSDKNKTIVERLEKEGLMTDFGRQKIADAKKNGQWNAPKTGTISEAQMNSLLELIKPHETAFSNYQSMSASVQKTYAKAYYDAKTEAGREKRLLWMIDRLNQNLKPM